MTSTSGCQQSTPGGGGFGGGSGFPQGGFTPPAGGFGEGGAPQPTPSGFPPGGFGGGGSSAFRGGFGGAFGTITSITDSTITIKSVVAANSSTTTVKTTASTTYQATTTVTADDVKKGSCVNAIGSDDVSGVLDARSVSISDPVNGTCPAAPSFGGGGFGGPGFVTSGNAGQGVGGA